ncbi:tryptophan 7-halogenase [Pseudoalteromonas haloplanktis]|uniref:Tryptophan 7-halogenase n=1 Tax=Pseudoalteromonas haloplanktis TaxID=228 RepID=A0ABU1B8L7_PSEHA|nr:tryptophan 7-halogenase [Pseudoalteromonas haloplanktis]MDQ9090874.1 tryptophan 7-halogenase [Pseudoalteromonas haloplanktis]
MNNKIQHIVVLGGGAAGWLSAGLLSAEHPDKHITLIESAHIAISGVGEGTWPSMRNTLKLIGIKEVDFLKYCDASFKQGSKFINWRNLTPGDNYYHPFMTPAGYLETDLHAYWQHHAASQKYADAINMQSFVCQAGLAPKQASTPEYAAVTNYGYHLDAGKFASFLKNHCENKLGVIHIMDDVVAVNNDNQGYIRSLTTKQHGEIKGDLFIDCSGARARLIAEHYNAAFINQEQTLFNNSAIAAHLPYNNQQQDIASATISTAQSHGWIWDIGLPSRRGIGHTYCDKYCDEHTAVKTLKNYAAQSVGAEAAEQIQTRKLSFTPGYRKHFWIKNCIAVGMSQGFIEPLEASALAMVELSLNMLSEQMPHDRVHMQLLATRFNQRFSYRWQRVIDFLKLHYILSERDDSQYWLDIKSPASIPARLTELLALWQYQPPSRFDLIENEEIFPSASYQYVLYGMGFHSQAATAENAFYNPKAGHYFYQQNRAKIAQCLQALPTNRTLLNQLLNNKA